MKKHIDTNQDTRRIAEQLRHRREFLKLGAAAAGAATLGLVTRSEASAADPNDLVLQTGNTVALGTQLEKTSEDGVPALSVAAPGGDAALSGYNTGAGFGVVGESVSGVAVHGHSDGGGTGVSGHANHVDGVGV